MVCMFRVWWWSHTSGLIQHSYNTHEGRLVVNVCVHVWFVRCAFGGGLILWETDCFLFVSVCLSLSVYIVCVCD